MTSELFSFADSFCKLGLETFFATVGMGVGLTPQVLGANVVLDEQVNQKSGLNWLNIIWVIGTFAIVILVFAWKKARK